MAPLRAGAAKVDITPKAGVQLSGAVGTYRPARLMADPLYARALVFEADGRKLCFLTLDATIVNAPYTTMIRKAAMERCGIEPDALMVHATQVHSAPTIGHMMVDSDYTAIPKELDWIRGGDDAYDAMAVNGAIEAIGCACESLRPVEIGVGSGIEGRMAHNRRAVKRDGSVGMPGRTWEKPLGPTWIRYIEGPIDPEVGVMCVRGEDLRMVSLLVHYTCHPVHVFPKLIISADWPGALAGELVAAHGEQCIPLVLNGACGNINPWDPFDPDYPDDHVRMGRVLAQTASRVAETLEFTSEAELDWRIRRLQIPIRQLTAEELAWCTGILEANPEPVFTDETRTQVNHDWMAAVSMYSAHLIREREGTQQYEVQVLRVGQTAFVGLPGEPFVEGQLAIKLASPTWPTYVAHCTSHYAGYIPTQEALMRGGHEVNTRYWAKLAPEALDMIVTGATELLGEVFG